jgi:hypothetical protein
MGRRQARAVEEGGGRATAETDPQERPQILGIGPVGHIPALKEREDRFRTGGMFPLAAPDATLAGQNVDKCV